MSTVAIVGLLLIVAFLFPELGRKGGLLASQNLTQAGVFFIFLGMGLSLKKEKWREGFRSPLLMIHLLIFQFLLSPLIGWGMITLFPSMDPRMKFALFFLTALPTTISTSTVFSQKAGENPALAAIASLSSNLFAVFLTPLWISLYFADRSFGSLPYLPLLKPILLNLIVPALLGALLRPLFGSFFERNSRIISKINMSIVFFILYAAFCDLFAMKIGGGGELSVKALLFSIFLTVIFLMISHGLLYWFGKRVHPAHSLTFLFSGAQKSIATGAPMALAVLAQTEGLFPGGLTYGLILLPFVIYHPAQIILGSWILKKESSST